MTLGAVGPERVTNLIQNSDCHMLHPGENVKFGHFSPTRLLNFILGNKGLLRAFPDV